MIKSMTGYGRASDTFDGKEITVEIKAVNHRYLEYSSRMLRAYNYVDDSLKKLVQGKISRGKIELGLVVNSTDSGTEKVEINTKLAGEYLTALRAMSEELGVKDDVTTNTLCRFSDIFVVSKVTEDEDKMQADILAVASIALENFVAMRVIEGEKLLQDITEHLDNIEANVRQIEERSPQTVSEYRNRLTQKLKDILGSTTLDEQRIITEVAIIGEKLAIDEESVRLHSHISQLRDILQEDGTVGRKLDFLVQEMNREINTMGSKSQDIDIAKLVVDSKSEIEKIREQIQNIE